MYLDEADNDSLNQDDLTDWPLEDDTEESDFPWQSRQI